MLVVNKYRTVETSQVHQKLQQLQTRRCILSISYIEHFIFSASLHTSSHKHNVSIVFVLVINILNYIFIPLFYEIIIYRIVLFVYFKF